MRTDRCQPGLETPLPSPAPSFVPRPSHAQLGAARCGTDVGASLVPEALNTGVSHAEDLR
jgi:hypothetical protein